MASVKHELVPPATDDEVFAAERWFAEECGIEMPDVYRELITCCNGVNFRGLTIYSTQDIAGCGLGLAESNQRIGQGQESPLRYVGQYQAMLLAYQKDFGKWGAVGALDEKLVSTDAVFDDLDDLMGYAVVACITNAFPEFQGSSADSSQE